MLAGAILDLSARTLGHIQNMDVEKLLNTTHGIIVIFCDYKNNHLSAGIIVQATVNLNIVTLNFPNSIYVQCST